MSMSAPRPPFIVSWIPSASSARRVDDVVAAERVQRQPVVRLLPEEDVDRGLGPKTLTPPASPAVPNASAPLVPVTVTLSEAPSPPPSGPRRSSPAWRQVGAGEVADDDAVGAAQSPEVDALDVVEVHRHARDVAGEQDAAAVRDDVDVLGDVRAEEDHLSEPSWPSSVSLPSPGFQWKAVAGAHQGEVVAVVAEDEVVVSAAEDRVGALRAEQLIGARAAVDRQLDHAGEGGGADAVVAAQGVDGEGVCRPLGVGDVPPAPPT